jgi:hypothetical protein
MRYRLPAGLFLALLLFLPCRLPAPPLAEGKLQCGNLIYAGSKSSVCFADKFLSDVANQTTLDVVRTFVSVKLDADGLFDVPFCVLSGEDSFSLPEKERLNLRKYLSNGGFILASPSCSDSGWDKAFRKEIAVCFPDQKLEKLEMSHPIFATVHQIPRLTCKNGNTTQLEGLTLNGRVVLIYSKEGLNDVANAHGCCCCGGNQINDCIRVNVNIFTYALLY